ncbi:hypothetical protein F4778DRAFT_615499 [Xylariomycetidae sp. FL2044]|nr:hypothetical protein F4778DRAFT_615499 [Xylariomycetidae sp. FL2044]
MHSTHTNRASAALAAFLVASSTTVQAHMIMKTPAPWGGSSLDNSPLSSSGSNYPCKLSGDPATFYSTEGLDNTMAVGETQTLSFTGSAVHGGGSCQLAISKDMQPSASTSWQVILSIEGGCPSKTGDGPDTYDFSIPDSVAPGQYAFAWTWISKLAGQPEYYMNCAPITVTGGSSKRSLNNESMSDFDLIQRDGDLPELFVANLQSVNDCKTEPGTDPEYPDPGANVEKPGSNNNFATPSGTGCVPKGATEGTGGSDSSSGSASGSASASGSTPSSSSAVAGGGGVFVTTNPASSGSFVTSVIVIDVSTTSPTSTSIPTSSSSSSSSPISTPSSAVSIVPFLPSASSSAAAAAPSSTPGTGSSGALSGACTDEGMFNCVGGSSYQQCASGTWSVMMEMPATTTCAVGQTMTLWGRGETGSGGALGRLRRRRGFKWRGGGEGGGRDGVVGS